MQPGEIGTYRTSHQHILVIIHYKPVVVEPRFQDLLKAAGLCANLLYNAGNFQNLFPVRFSQGPNILNRLRMGRDIQPPFQCFKLFKAV